MMNNILELKEKLKKGTISYFDLSSEEAEEVKKALEEEITESRKEIEEIKDKIKQEKNSFKNS